MLAFAVPWKFLNSSLLLVNVNSLSLIVTVIFWLISVERVPLGPLTVTVVPSTFTVTPCGIVIILLPIIKEN